MNVQTEITWTYCTSIPFFIYFTVTITVRFIGCPGQDTCQRTQRALQNAYPPGEAKGEDRLVQKCLTASPHESDNHFTGTRWTVQALVDGDRQQLQYLKN